MPLTPEPLAASVPPSLTLPILAVGGAIAAGLTAFVQHAREIARLRQQIADLDDGRSPAATPAPAAPSRHGRGGPMFGALYDERPSPLLILSAWPGTAPAAVAAALSVMAAVLLLHYASATQAQAQSYQRETARVAAARDSLTAVVQHLRDSTRPATQPQPAPTSKAAPSPRRLEHRVAARTRGAAIAPAPTIAPAPAVVPAPRLDPAELGPAAKSANP